MTQPDQLREFINSRRISQSALAKLLGVSREYVNRTIAGAEPVTPSFIGRFSLAFGFTAAETVFGNGTQHSSPNPQIPAQEEPTPCP